MDVKTWFVLTVCENQGLHVDSVGKRCLPGVSKMDPTDLVELVSLPIIVQLLMMLQFLHLLLLIVWPM